MIRVVLDDEDVAVGGPRQQPPALLEADQEARWILEVGHDIQRFHPAAVQTQPLVGGFERVELDAVRLLRHADHLGLDVSKRRDRARVGWQLDEHHVARIEQHARDEIESLLRAGRDEQLLESDANLAAFEDGRDFLEQRTVSPGRSVLQNTAVLPTEQCRGDLAKLGPRKGVRRGISWSERDDVPPGRDHFPHPADGGLFHLLSGVGEELIVGGHAERWPLTSLSDPCDSAAC